MCIAIVRQAGAVIDDTTLETCDAANSDGGGYAFTRDGKVVIRKGFMDFKAFINNYHADVLENDDSTFLIHFRISTGGDASPENTHPFGNENAAMIHNGHFFYPGSTGPSDTNILATAINEYLDKDTVVSKLKDITDWIGSGNKLAFLFGDNTFAIANEAAGHWKDRVWYSNSSYLRYGVATSKYSPYAGMME